MRYGFIVPGGGVHDRVAMAVEAEAAGWDGIFLWEGVYHLDAWACLAAMAVKTERIRLGTMLTPLPRRLPWEVAAQAATVDQLSNGRVILAVGLGVIEPEHLGDVNQERDRKIRAEQLDEALAVLDGLWSGEAFDFDGKHFKLHCPPGPKPVQQPRIPVWVVGRWPAPKSMRRAARWYGLVPEVPKPDGDGFAAVQADDVRGMLAFVTEHRDEATAAHPYDVVVDGQTRGDDPEATAQRLRDLYEAGCTWWLEADWSGTEESVWSRLRQGPPR